MSLIYLKHWSWKSQAPQQAELALNWWTRLHHTAQCTLMQKWPVCDRTWANARLTLIGFMHSVRYVVIVDCVIDNGIALILTTVCGNVLQRQTYLQEVLFLEAETVKLAAGWRLSRVYLKPAQCPWTFRWWCAWKLAGHCSILFQCSQSLLANTGWYVMQVVFNTGFLSATLP